MKFTRLLLVIIFLLVVYNKESLVGYFISDKERLSNYWDNQDFSKPQPYWNPINSSIQGPPQQLERPNQRAAVLQAGTEQAEADRQARFASDRTIINSTDAELDDAIQQAIEDKAVEDRLAEQEEERQRKLKLADKVSAIRRNVEILKKHAETSEVIMMRNPSPLSKARYNDAKKKYRDMLKTLRKLEKLR